MKNLKYYSALLGLTTSLVLTQQQVVLASNLNNKVINTIDESEDNILEKIDKLNNSCENIEIVLEPNLFDNGLDNLLIKCIDTKSQIKIESDFYKNINKLLTMKNSTGEFKINTLYLYGLDDKIDFNKIYLYGIKQIAIYNSQKDFNYNSLSKEKYYGNGNKYESVNLLIENNMITNNLKEWVKTENFNDAYLCIEYLGNNVYSSNIEIINNLSYNKSCMNGLMIMNEIYSSEYLNSVSKINTKKLYLSGFFKLTNDNIDINFKLNKNTNYLNLIMTSDSLSTSSRFLGNIDIESNCPGSRIEILGVHDDLIINKNTKFKLKNFDDFRLLGVEIFSKIPFFPLIKLKSLSIDNNNWYKNSEQKYYKFLSDFEIGEKKYIKKAK